MTKRVCGSSTAIRPNFGARAELLKWYAAYDDLEHFAEGLRKARLDVSGSRPFVRAGTGSR